MHTHCALHKIFFAIVLAACVSCSTVGQENPAYNKETEDKIKQVENNLSEWIQVVDSVNTYNLQQRMEYFKIRALSIAVIHDHKIEWARGYGVMDTSTRQPVTVQTLFQAGSISKSLNAMGVLKLAQDKKLDLYTDINTYLSSWKFPYDSVSKGKKITIANLLSHTAGLSLHGFPGYKRGDTIPTLPEILDGKHPANTEPVRSQFEPGLRFQYSGGGTTISQLIVQDVTHEPYDVYMWNNVLKPLGMTMSSYTQPPSKEKEKFLATAYRADGKEVEGKYHIYPEQAAAGLWTNPTDLAKYIIETQLSLQGKSNKVLSQEMTKLRLTPYIDSSAAFGVFIEEHGGEKYFGHNGADEGFVSVYKGSFDSGDGVVVMVNSDNGAILGEVMNSVATVYGWKDFYKPVVKKIVSISDTLFDTYAGKYFLEGDTFSISKKGSDYFLIVDNVQSFKINFSSDVEFFSTQIPIIFTFEKDDQGKVKDIYFKQGTQELRARRMKNQ